MTFNYADLASVAKELLIEFGAPVVLKVKSAPVYDPATGDAAGATVAPFTRNAVLLDYAAGQTLAPGGLIQTGDKRLILEPGVAPGLEDNVIANNVEYAVKGFSEISPANYPVVYDLHLGSG